MIPASVYISEEYGGPSDFANEDGKFPSLETANSGMSFKVDGDPASTQQTQQEPQRQQLGAFRRFGLSSSSQSSASSSSASVSATRKRPSLSKGTYSLKVILADLDGKKIGRHIRMLYFNVTEETANVINILEMAKNGFETDDLILAQANGLRMEDNNVTRDFSFWKSNSRKVFAVSKTNYEAAEQPVRNKNYQHFELMGAINELDTKIGNAILFNRTETLENAISTTRLLQPLKQALRCLICLDVCLSPIRIGLCCKQILGCTECVQSWGDAVCPHCRAEDYQTLELGAFNEVQRILHELQD